MGAALPPPQDTDSLRELSRLLGRDSTRRFIEGVIADADVDLTPGEGWLLGRAHDGAIAAETLDTPEPADRAALREALARLGDRGLVEGSDPARLTASGQAIRSDLMSARERSLRYLVSDWEPRDPQLDAVIVRLSEELAVSDGA